MKTTTTKTLIVISAILNIVLLAYALKKRHDFTIKYTETIPTYSLGRDKYLESLSIDTSDVVFIGDSETQFFLLTETFNNLHVKNRGIIGDSSGPLLLRIDNIIKNNPKKIFIQIGINDIIKGIKPKSIANNIDLLIKKIKSNSPKTSIYIQNILPSNEAFTPWKPIPVIEQTNSLLLTISHSENVNYIDLFSSFIDNGHLNASFDCGDGIHLSAKGYAKWQSLIKPFVY